MRTYTAKDDWGTGKIRLIAISQICLISLFIWVFYISNSKFGIILTIIGAVIASVVVSYNAIRKTTNTISINEKGIYTTTDSTTTFSLEFSSMKKITIYYDGYEIIDNQGKEIKSPKLCSFNGKKAIKCIRQNTKVNAIDKIWSSITPPT